MNTETQFKLKHLPMPGTPLYARVTWPDGFAYFNGPEHAADYLDQWGSVGDAARFYIRWVEGAGQPGNAA